jgi:5-methylcytosine-specific restriction endonuclease McrBC GTP-binding regulatory subunit McrB
VDDFGEVKKLLFETERKYIVLQGAPGTGKTFTANKIAKDSFLPENVFFDQFHAETTYSDFVYGIEPDLDNPGAFKKKEGVLYKAILKALETEDKVLLIIDEINRANLANVLGPVFYLFESSVGDRVSQIKIGETPLKHLPSNLYVIATMNTADRSLAVVDFALRRRFAWYTLRPKVLSDTELRKGEVFDLDLYNSIAGIFERYATDEELNLQPGQSYFVTDGSTEMTRSRIIYELMPLIKEYLREGYLTKAKESFSNLFYEKVQLQLFE